MVETVRGHSNNVEPVMPKLIRELVGEGGLSGTVDPIDRYPHTIHALAAGDTRDDLVEQLPPRIGQLVHGHPSIIAGSVSVCGR